jgi:hypothetical protein
MTHLKEARDNKQLEHFISEREKTHPKASKTHFHATIKAMAAGKSKATKAASKRAHRGG